MAIKGNHVRNSETRNVDAVKIQLNVTTGLKIVRDAKSGRFMSLRFGAYQGHSAAAERSAGQVMRSLLNSLRAEARERAAVMEQFGRSVAEGDQRLRELGIVPARRIEP